MKFNAREDIKVSIDQAFQAVSDFDGFERAALRRGAEVTRVHNENPVCVGTQWEARFPYRNRERVAKMVLETFDAPNTLIIRSQVSGIEAEICVDLIALLPHRTRMNFSIDLRPKTIPARLLLQSLKLARGSLLKRFRARVAEFALSLEQQYEPPDHL